MSNALGAGYPAQKPGFMGQDFQKHGLLDGERMGAYRAALRHSHIVRFLRVLIPAGATAAVIALVAWSMFRPMTGLQGLEMGPVALTGTKVTMEKPKLTGFRKDGKPYEVTSVAASQDIRKPGIVELEQITARLGAVGDNATHMTSAHGIYDMKSEKLELSGGITVRTDSGDKAALQAAHVDLKAGDLDTKQPVKITTSNGGSVNANSMRVTESGKVIVFEGGVQTVLYPQQHDQTNPQATPQTTTTSGQTAPPPGAAAQPDKGNQQ